MSAQPVEGWTRRRFLGGLTVAGMVGCLGLRPHRVTAEPPPETATLKLSGRRGRGVGVTCQAAMYVAEEFLRGEGFTDVHYVTAADTIEAYKALAVADRGRY